MRHVWGSARNLLAASRDGRLLRALMGHVGSKADPNSETGEVGAWKRSVPALLELLDESGLGHIHVILEHRLPYIPRRVDAILCGSHPTTGEHFYVLVELKQWSKLTSAGVGLVDVPGARQPELHPSEQVRRYCQHLIDFNPFLARRPKLVRGFAYLHECTEASAGLDFEPDDFGRLFTGAESDRLVDDLRRLLGADPDLLETSKQAALWLTKAKTAPARTLLRTVADVLAERTGYVLLDEQQVAFEIVRNAIEDDYENSGADDSRPKKVVVVHGGPGSGKSAIAIALLSTLTRHGRSAAHATGSRAFTETLRRVAVDGNVRAERIFTYFNSFDRAAKNSVDVVICDEAHRVRRNTKSANPFGQIGELVDAARVPVFLLDRNQVVRPGEIGAPTDIVNVAAAKGCVVEQVYLDGQFRCGGSAYYDEWVLRLLGLAGDQEPIAWSELVADTDDQYAVDAVDSPASLESWLRRQADNFRGTARMAAGFCWPWSAPVRDGKTKRLKLVDDIDIDGWRRPWNAKQDASVPDVPSASLWATDPRGFGQVGCIYTAQGFEYDWAGVIFGADLVIRDGQWRAQPEYSHDKAINGAKADVFDRLVRNTYKVLMTRGMQGVCLYSEDEQTNAFLQRYTR